MKKKKSSIGFVILFIVGLSLFLYPSLSDYWNSFHQSKAIASYAEFLTEVDDEVSERVLKEAYIYNEKIATSKRNWILSEAEKVEYSKLLDITGSGIMGYIEIPKISCALPIYHGTDEAVLQIAVGHIEGSSLPVGGSSTHCVLSGHRGLPSAKLFSDLDELKQGDTFMIRVIDETLTYEVDQIRIVDPDDLSNLGIEEGEDLFTLVTCTPYGINTHRLLVRGHRIATIDMDYIKVVADATQIEPITVAPALAIPMLIVLLIWLLIRYRKEKRRIKIA